MDQVKALIAVTNYNKNDNSKEMFVTLIEILNEIEQELTIDHKDHRNDSTENNLFYEIDTKIANESKVG